MLLKEVSNLMKFQNIDNHLILDEIETSFSDKHFVNLFPLISVTDDGTSSANNLQDFSTELFPIEVTDD